MTNVFVIAEAGVNHNGKLDLALKMVEVAAKCKANAIKFQTFKAQNLVTQNAPRAEYQKINQPGEKNQFEMLKKLELSFDEHIIVKKYCDQLNIEFMSTPFDEECAEFLNKIGMSRFKIPSGEITNYPLLKKIASFKKEIILSTGMSTIDEIKDAVDALLRNGSNLNQITVLHCSTDYPADLKDIHLNAIKQIKSIINSKIGYSDHTLGIEVSLAAVALGATVIEKHFTLDKNMNGPDHRCSLDQFELENLIKSIRNISLSLGDEIKKPSDKELLNRSIARKSLVAKSSIKKDEIFTEANLTTKRPGTGISPMNWEKIIGTKALRDYLEDEII
jgi:N,N'-diacetyllegionaminate synthase